MLGELFNLERILGFCEKFLYFLKINLSVFQFQFAPVFDFSRLYG